MAQRAVSTFAVGYREPANARVITANAWPSLRGADDSAYDGTLEARHPTSTRPEGASMAGSPPSPRAPQPVGGGRPGNLLPSWAASSSATRSAGGRPTTGFGGPSSNPSRHSCPRSSKTRQVVDQAVSGGLHFLDLSGQPSEVVSQIADAVDTVVERLESDGRQRWDAKAPYEAYVTCLRDLQCILRE